MLKRLLKVLFYCGICCCGFVCCGVAINAYAVEVGGFVDARIGVRTQSNSEQKNTSIGELRLQLDNEQDVAGVSINLTVDFVVDTVVDSDNIDLETGEGAIDLRQLNLVFSPADYLDVKIGRQILTWGTGDLLFINDLFAKDWNAFLIGRDDEYLKAPTDAAKFSLFFDAVNIDLVYTPRFAADRYIDGKRVSFFDRTLNASRGRRDPVEVQKPDKAFSDDELSLRLYRSFAANEAAVYYYHGFWKSPAGQDPLSNKATFPKLDVFGASLRGPLAKGIAHIEAGYYKSASDAAANPLIRNSELRFLLGYEQEIATELTAALQYYLERKRDYQAYLASLPTGAMTDDENRHVVTLRLTKRMLQQDLKLSLFNFYSPSDKDGYFRTNVSYKLSDSLKLEAGGNYFYGEQVHTFFAQFENDSNVYSAVHYEF